MDHKWDIRYDRSRRVWVAIATNINSPYYGEEWNAYDRTELCWQIDHADDPNNQDLLCKRVV